MQHMPTTAPNAQPAAPAAPAAVPIEPAQDGGVGLGVDIVEIDRMRKILDQTPSFARKVFTEAEQEYCNRTSNPATHYAARFAAKEAVSKALGTGLYVGGVRPQMIEVRRDSKGKPAVALHGRARELARELGVLDVPLSLTYTHNVAVANAVAITRASQVERERRRDIKAELGQRFKEVRGMLDDLGSGTAGKVDAAAPAAQPAAAAASTPGSVPSPSASAAPESDER